MNPKSALCKICNVLNDPADYYDAREMMFGLRDSFLYFQCRHCECLQIAEFPANIASYYPTEYYSFSFYEGKRFKGFTGSLYKARNTASLFRNGFFQKLLHRLSPVAKWDTFQKLGITKETSILDVGCGNGDMFLYPLQEIGFKNVCGCDPFIKETIHYPNGLTIYKNDVFEMKGTWDIIIYNHAFEHVPNPLENLKKVAELLSPGGYCILRIPTVPCYAWSHYKTNWVQLDAPRHYFLHSPKSIDILAKESALFLDKVIYDSTFFQFEGSEMYLKNISLVSQKKNKGNFIKRKTDRLRFKRMAKKLNQNNEGDQAAFYLQRNG